MTTASPGNLSPEFYGHYDQSDTEIGGRRFVLPHTIEHTARGFARPVQIMIALAIAAFVLGHLHGDKTVVDFIGLYLLGGGLIWVAIYPMIALVWLTGWRDTTAIEVRPDGLVIDDDSFFPAHAVHGLMAHTTNDPEMGLVSEFALTLQIGTQHIPIPELDPSSATLFKTEYQRAIREIWHRQN